MADPAGRFGIAFDDPTLKWDATFTWLDQTYPNLVAYYTIERGRAFELDRTGPAHVTVRINDTDGILDPTNAAGPFYGKIEPLLQAGIGRYNPVTDAWDWRFRGWIGEIDYAFDPSQQVNFLTVELVDIFEISNAIEMVPGLFGDAPAPGAEIQYDAATMDGRIVQALTNGLGADNDLYWVVFTGNVTLKRAAYSLGDPLLNVIQEAADGEFPGVANIYTDRFGRLAAHGRLAKFDPEGVASSSGYAAWSGATAYIAGDKVTSGGLSYVAVVPHTNHVPPNATYWLQIPDVWDWHDWQAGDGATVASNPAQFAQIRGFAFNRGLARIINSAVFTSVDPNIAAVTGSDSASISQYGFRSRSWSNLLTDQGLLGGGTTTAEELALFADYVVSNYAAPANRVTELTFRSMSPSQSGASENWRLLSKVDISDRVAVTIASPGGGGFTAQQFFVEGIREECRPLNSEHDLETVTLDVSPAAYFDVNPFPLS